MLQTREFYASGGLNAETYDLRTETPSGEIDFYIDRSRASDGPVLELGCGTGRVTWPIARAGIPIVGLDRERAMLDQAEIKGGRESPAVRRRARFVVGDMTEFTLEERFALVIIPFRAFLMLLTTEDQRRSLGCVRRHLRKEGRLIIDIFDPLYASLVEERSTPQRDFPVMRNPLTGHAVTVDVLERTNDHLQQLIAERWRFRELSDDGRVVREEVEDLKLRWIFRNEMRYLFELSGFAIEEELSDFHGAPPAYGREQIWIVRKT